MISRSELAPNNAFVVLDELHVPCIHKKRNTSSQIWMMFTVEQDLTVTEDILTPLESQRALVSDTSKTVYKLGSQTTDAGDATTSQAQGAAQSLIEDLKQIRLKLFETEDGANEVHH